MSAKAQAPPGDPPQNSTAPHGTSHHAAELVGEKPAAVRELTPRAVIAGIVVAAIMGASYPYIVLKLGFGPNMSVVAAFFGYLALGIAFRQTYNRWENNIVETCGTAASQTAFMCVLLAAFDLLAANPKVKFHIALTPLQSFAWLSAAGLLGVLLAAPLRQHYIIDEKLTFADGVAAGETLIVLDSRGEGGRQAAVALGAGAVASGFSFAMRQESYLLKWIPDAYEVGNKLLQRMHVGLSYSLLSLGSGALVGLRINVSMMLGSILSWVVAPLLLTHLGWVAADAKRNDVLFWVMWPATGMMVCAGLASLALKWRVLAKTFKSLARAQVGGGDFPLRWVGIGVVITGTGLVIIQRVNLGIPPWLTLIAIALSLPLMLVGLRVLGETNWGPITSLSNMMQGVFAAISPGNLAVDMVASGTTGTIATSSEAIMQDYRAGRMVGTTPRNMTIMQLVGVPIGAAAVSWMYPYLRSTYGIVGDDAKLTAPSAATWAGFAAILKGGVSSLPPHAIAALVIFSLLGVAFTACAEVPRLRAIVLSPTGIGIGMLVPFSVVSTMFLGGLLGFFWEKKDKKSSDLLSVPLCSGLIAGEAIVAVLVPVLVALGVIRL